MKNKIKVWCEIYKLVWSFSPSHLIFISFLGLVQAVSIILQLFTIQSFIRYIQYEFSDNKTLIYYLIAIAVVLIIRRLYDAYFNYNINKHIFWARDIIKLNFIKKAALIPLNEFYKPNFETKKNMAIQGAESASKFLIIGLILLSFNIPYFIFIGIYYSFFSPIMIFVLLLIIVPSFFAITKNMQEYKSLEDKISTNRKTIEYYFRCISNIKYIKETKILRAGDYFFDKINIETNKYYISTHNHSKLILKNSLLAETLKFAGYIVIFIILLLLTTNNTISIGLLVATITSLNDMYSVFNEMVDRDFKSLSSFYYEVTNYLDFFHMTDSYPVFKKSKNKSIILNNISYKYPNCNKYAIKNFNCVFENGKTYAIVGENGAGKTTLSKLILGLLPPTDGNIEIPESLNGNNESDTFSALFQNHAKYPFSLRDNVMLSKSSSPISDTKIHFALKQCGLDYEDKKLFPNSLDTVLSREFNGIELSGGQWQRISLARCIYRASDILLLDEPTSAIDPINESSLFHVFNEISQKKTTIIITHRLGVVSIADYILVLDHGQLIEAGAHDELISLDGKYKELYIAQSRNYFE